MIDDAFRKLITETQQKMIDEISQQMLFSSLSGSVSTCVKEAASFSADSIRQAIDALEREGKIKKAEQPIELGFKYMGNVFWMRVIQSPYACKVETKTRGIPAKNKPNSHRPYYRRITVNTPMAYMIRGGDAVIHPALMHNISGLA